MLPSCSLFRRIVEPGVRPPDRQRIGGRDADEERASSVRSIFRQMSLLLTTSTDSLLRCVITDILSVAATSRASQRTHT